jgi:hypothetical protein
MMLYIVSSVACAEPLVEIGAGQAIYSDNDSSTDWTLQGRVGHKAFPLYLTAGWDQPKVKVLGQPIADTNIYTFGLGTWYEVGSVSLFVESGLALVDPEIDSGVQQEVVYTYLVGRHNVEGRPVPVDVVNGNEGYTSSYEVDDAPFLRIGAQWQVFEHVAVSASYRFLEADTEMFIKRSGWEEGKGYWREDNTANFGAAEVVLWVTF